MVVEEVVEDEVEEVEFGPLQLVIGEELGRGSFGQVSKCWLGDNALALKKMEKALHTPEIQPWCVGLRHTNIIRCERYFDDEKYHYVMDIHELDLFSWILIADEMRYVV